ncbi:MAG: cytochrome c [Nitrospirales bacterium]
MLNRIPIVISLVLCFGVAAMAQSAGTSVLSSRAQDKQASGFRYGGSDLNESERAGAEIWFNATAGNSRFHTYVFQQRLGVSIDWYGVLNAHSREQRFNRWGLINDPECCKPGDPNCPAKNAEDTYGFDYCPGDETLLQFVGKTGYKDPACHFKDAPLAPEDPHGPKDRRQSACDLEFGTSTGALGLRKFPNPNFNKEQWLKVNKGRLGSWAGYTEKVRHSDDSVAPFSRLTDGSIEPPFRIGMACGACHIAFDPLRPPKHPAKPQWENLSGTVGNQYSRFSQILGSGMAPDTIEYQVFAHARPGTVDTSAVPTDQVNNPGTINAIMNITMRPMFQETVTKWRKTAQCADGPDERSCWCEPAKSGKCWKKSTAKEPVRHILKGGEDSIGDREAVQRVYINIGSCSEEAWVNHLTDMRQLDPMQRNFGQTPFDIGQARRDCRQFRAIEDRVDDVVHFLLSARPSDLYKARGLKDNRDLVEQLDKEFGAGSVDRGKARFAQHCARCHSTQSEPFGARDFREVSKDPKDNNLRIDWLGNDKLTPVSEVGTHQARALHSNHMGGHVWEEYGSEDLRTKPVDPNIKGPADGGRGYYRNISLLSVWAHAPFMHNNAIGPELCGGPQDDHYHSPYVDRNDHPFANPPACRPFDPSVNGRYELYKASMKDLLYPNKRVPKITMFNREVLIQLFPKLPEGELERYIDGTIIFPAGTPSSRIGNFRHKELINDLVLSKVDFAKLKAKYVARYGPEKGAKVAATIQEKATYLLTNPKRLVEAGAELREVYSNSLALRENEGHRFGEDLSDTDKNALIAFLATL